MFMSLLKRHFEICFYPPHSFLAFSSERRFRVNPKRVITISALPIVIFSLIFSQAVFSQKKIKVLGLNKVIGFYGAPKHLKSPTFVLGHKDWQYWERRSGVAAAQQVWFPIMENTTVEQGASILTGIDFHGNPKPVVCIDEFGFDFGGDSDKKCASILLEAKKQKQNLSIAIWQMKGPISEPLAEAYRKSVDLILLESYVGRKEHYWWILTQVQAARFHGLLEKTVVGLGLGFGGRRGELWARTKHELEQQIRFVRLIAPESPGIAFFGPDTPSELSAYADNLCQRFYELPTDGSGLPDDLIKLHNVFKRRYSKPTLVCSPQWVQPNRSFKNPRNLATPLTYRTLILNLGERDARNVLIRLKHADDGPCFAKTVVSKIPKRSVTTIELQPVLPMHGWDTWKLEILPADKSLFSMNENPYWPDVLTFNLKKTR